MPPGSCCRERASKAKGAVAAGAAGGMDSPPPPDEGHGAESRARALLAALEGATAGKVGAAEVGDEAVPIPQLSKSRAKQLRKKPGWYRKQSSALSKARPQPAAQ